MRSPAALLAEIQSLLRRGSLLQLADELLDIARYRAGRFWVRHGLRIMAGAALVTIAGYLYVERPYLSGPEHDAYKIQTLETHRLKLRTKQMNLHADFQDAMRRTADPAVAREAAATLREKIKALNDEISAIDTRIGIIRSMPSN